MIAKDIERAREILRGKGVRDWKTRKLYDEVQVKSEFETIGLFGSYHRVRRISDGREGALALIVARPQIYWDNLGVFGVANLPTLKTYKDIRAKQGPGKFVVEKTTKGVESQLRDLEFLWSERGSHRRN